MKDTKTHITETAFEMFWKTSYHATNMNELSKEAGVNKATVYQHFKSKEELSLAAINYSTDATIKHIFESSFAATEKPLERIKQIYAAVYVMHNKIYEKEGLVRGCPFVNIGSELATTNEEVRKSVNTGFGKFKTFYEKIIKDLITAGDLAASNIDTNRLAEDLQSNMNATLLEAKLKNDPSFILKGGERAIRYLT